MEPEECKPTMYMCHLCPNVFAREDLLNDHKNSHNEEKPFHCEICNFRALTSDSLRRHKLIHNRAKPFQCKFCNYKAVAPHLIIGHESRIHSNKSVKTLNSMKKLIKKGLTTPARNHDENNEFECGVCKYKCAHKSDFISHVLTHGGKTQNGSTLKVVFPCSLCDKKFISKDTLAAHIKTSHRSYICGVCDYETEDQLELLSHMKNHVEPVSDESQDRPEINLGVDDLKSHKCSQPVEEHSTDGEKSSDRINVAPTVDDQLFHCDECDFQCSKKALFKQHKIRHLRTFGCDFCDFAGISKSVLKDHMRNHSQEKPFQCSQCEYTCKRNYVCREHLVKVHCVLPYCCIICDQEFTDKKDMTQHMSTHSIDMTKQKTKCTSRFCCTVCGQKFSHHGELTKHLVTHSLKQWMSKHVKNIQEKPNENSNDQLYDPSCPNGKQQTFYCEYCEYSGSTRSQIKVHMRVHTQEKPYACTQCDFRTNWSGCLKDHMLNLHSILPYGCNVCGEKFTSRDLLSQHKKTHSLTPAISPFICGVCSKKFTTNVMLNKHVRSKHSVKNGNSKHGQKVRGITSENGRLQQTKPACSNIKPITGQTAESKLEVSTRNDNSTMSQNGHENVEKSTKKRVDLKNIQDSLWDGDRFVCDECDFTCIKLLSMRTHKIKHRNRFVCKFCGHVTVSNSSLAIHIRKHTKEKPYSCADCDLNFSRKELLKSHIIRRHTEKPYACDVCDRKFVSPDHLSQHMTIHSPTRRMLISMRPPRDKTHQCPHCEHKTAYAVCLRYHIKRKHTKDLDYCCDVCGKGFIERSHLRDHRLIKHSGNKPFKCTQCHYKTALKRYLRSHMLIMHFTPNNAEPIASVKVVESIDESDVNRKKNSVLECHSNSDAFDEGVEANLITTDILSGVPPIDNTDAERCNGKADPNNVASLWNNDRFECDECEFTCLKYLSMRNHIIKHRKKLVCESCGYVAVSVSSLELHRPECSKRTHLITHNTAEPLSRGHLTEASIPLERPLDNVNQDINVLISTHDGSPPLSKVHISDTKGTVSEEGSHQTNTSLSDGVMDRGVNKEQNCGVTSHISALEGVDKNIDTAVENSVLPHLHKNANAKKTVGRSTIARLWNSDKFICDECDFTCLKFMSMRSHKLKHRKRFVCKFCGYSAASNVSLKNHVRTHTKEKPFECANCDYKCSRVCSLKKHMIVVHSEKPFCCTLCSKKFVSQNLLTKHLTTHSPSHMISKKVKQPLAKTHKCPHCEHKTANAGHLQHHIQRKHTKELAYYCDVCGKGYVIRRELEKHILNKHSKDKPFKCVECDYKTAIKSSLKHHTRYVHFKPRSSDTSLKYVNNVEDHDVKDKQNNGVTCSSNVTLPDSVDSDNTVTITTVVSLESQIDQEDENGTKTVGQDTIAILWNHDQFSCDECDFSCLKYLSMKNHKIKHKNKFVCDTCGFVTVSNSALACHRRRHTDDRPYPCPHCEYKSVRNCDLKSHILRMHTKEITHCCHVCGKGFSIKYELTQHLLRKHKL